MPTHLVQMPVLKNFIGNEFCSPMASDVPLINPSCAEVLGYQVYSSETALSEALRHADLCHKSKAWFGLGAQRADYLRAIADKLHHHTHELAEIEAVNTGVLLSQTQYLMQLLPLIFRAAAAELRAHPDCEEYPGRGSLELWHKPWGPALCLAPWNSPAPIAAHKLASALAAGAPAILKSSELTPFSAQRMFELIAECDLPPGAAQLIHGSSREGALLGGDPRIRAISFTGGLSGGKAIAALCSPTMKRFQLELGGHNPFIILADADLPTVLDGLMAGLTTLNGQWCRAIGRIFVPKAMKEDLIEGFLQRLQKLTLGPALDPQSNVGPLMHRQHKNLLEARLLELQSLGGTIISAADPLDADGCYFSPKLVQNLELQYDRHEIFGPVATLHSYQDLESLAATVNDNSLGLAAYIYGSDQTLLHQLARQLNFGSIKINCVTLTSLIPTAPRSAWGQAGFGDEGNFATFDFFRGSCQIGSSI